MYVTLMRAATTKFAHKCFYLTTCLKCFPLHSAREFKIKYIMREKIDFMKISVFLPFRSI